MLRWKGSSVVVLGIALSATVPAWSQGAPPRSPSPRRPEARSPAGSPSPRRPEAPCAGTASPAADHGHGAASPDRPAASDGDRAGLSPRLRAASPNGYPPGYGQPGYQYPPPGYQPYPPAYYPPERRALPETIEDEGQPVPPGYHRSTRVRRGPMIGGWIVFGIFYGFAVLAANETRDGGVLAVPVVGPMLYTDKDSCSSFGSTSSYCSKTDTSSIRLFDTLGQATGAALLLAAYGFPNKVMVLDNPYAAGWTVTPLAGRGSAGLGALGRF